MNEARTIRESGRGSAPSRPSRFSTLSGARFWSRWHRYIAVLAALFLLFASTTGGLVAFTEFFGEEEALREATRDRVSSVTLGSPASEWMDPPARRPLGTGVATGYCRQFVTFSVPETCCLAEFVPMVTPPPEGVGATQTKLDRAKEEG